MKLEELRRDIDKIDQELVQLFHTRFKIVEEIAKLKGELEVSIEDNAREKEVVENYKKAAEGKLDAGFVEELVNLILSYSKRIQSEIKPKK